MLYYVGMLVVSAVVFSFGWIAINCGDKKPDSVHVPVNEVEKISDGS